jgi:hypothetical protein
MTDTAVAETAEIEEPTDAELEAVEAEEELELIDDEPLDEQSEQPIPKITQHQWLQIVDAMREVEDAQRVVGSLQADLKGAKKRLEEHQATLQNLIRAAERGERLLFDTEAIEDEEESHDDWRLMPVEILATDFGLTDATATLIAERNELPTMGELVDFMNAKGDFWIKDLKGVGPTKAEAIADAMAAFNAKHRSEPVEPEKPADWARAEVDILEQRGVTAGAIAALKTAGYHLVGPLVDATDGGKADVIRSIKGIGPKWSLDIATAIEAIRS